MLATSLISACVFATGCDHYEFDIVRPPELARHIGDEQEERFQLDPLEYRVQSAEGRLIIKPFNPTNDTILLLGRMSSAVDAHGESHPLPDQTIAPASFVKLILPPLRPQVAPAGPMIGIGFSVVGYRSQPSWRGYRYDPSYATYESDEPRYYDVYDVSNPMYWDWEGETDVRLTLVYRRGNDEFKHEFTIHRKRM